jgi:hypothetical protein
MGRKKTPQGTPEVLADRPQRAIPGIGPPGWGAEANMIPSDGGFE